MPLGFTVLTANTTAIAEMSDTLIALLIAILPLIVFLAFWKAMKAGWF